MVKGLNTLVLSVTCYNKNASHDLAAEIFRNCATSDYAFCDLDSHTTRSMWKTGTNCAMMCWNSSSQGQGMTVSADNELSGSRQFREIYCESGFFEQRQRCRFDVVWTVSDIHIYVTNKCNYYLACFHGAVGEIFFMSVRTTRKVKGKYLPVLTMRAYRA
jgi:hypothetical protein